MSAAVKVFLPHGSSKLAGLDDYGKREVGSDTILPEERNINLKTFLYSIK